MKLVINPTICRRERLPHRRKLRRFIYLGVAAQRMGVEVCLHLDGGLEIETYSKQPGYKFLRYAAKWPREKSPVLRDGDVYFATDLTVRHWRNELPKGGSRVAWKETIKYEHDAETGRWVDFLVAYIWKPADYCTENHKSALPSGHWLAADKVVSVPWLANERCLVGMDDDGMTDAYINCDLAALRARYSAREKSRRIGFIGCHWPARNRVARGYAGDPDVSFAWHGGGRLQLPAGEYLEWLSGCECVLNLPGDTWKCSRHCEAVMMGVPVVQLRGTIDLDVSMTERNAIIVDDWLDKATILERLEDATSIAAEADKVYRSAWSLQGQLMYVMEKAGWSF